MRRYSEAVKTDVRRRMSPPHRDTQGITCKRVLPDNGSAYRIKPWREACTALGLTPKRTRPYTPRTNGKEEGSSRPCWLNGPTPCLSKPQANGTGDYRAICRSTTAAGATWPWRAALPISSSDCYGLQNDLVRKHS
jgi:transposase InsO family protein